MRALRRRILAVAIPLLMALASGCSGIGTIVDQTAATAVAPPGERWHSALEMLGRGEEEQAEELLVELRDEPGYQERAKHMLEQIRRPVHRYFPASHFNVRLRSGQSLSALSRHYLDDPLKFFALARYNGIVAPNQLTTGQLIRIPLTEHARRIRTEEMGSPKADDPIDDSAGTGKAEPPDPEPAAAEDGAADTDTNTNTDEALSRAERQRVRYYYREATIAFQQQDLDGTLLYCERVLELDADHENCLGYRSRARALKRQLERIQQEGNNAGGDSP